MPSFLDSSGFDEFGYSDLHNASAEGSINDVSLLLKEGADVQELTLLSDLTPLHVAALDGKLEVMDLLINEGAQVNARCRLGRTPLHVLMSTTSVSEKVAARGIQMLVSAWADFNLGCNEGLTPLQHGCGEKRCKALVQYMAQMQHWSGQHVISDVNLRLIKMNPVLDEQFKKCLNELSEIGKTEISGYVLLDNLVIKGPKALAAFTFNQDIAEFFEDPDLKTKFPLFGKSMVKMWEKAKEEASRRWD